MESKLEQIRQTLIDSNIESALLNTNTLRDILTEYFTREYSSYTADDLLEANEYYGFGIE